MRTFKDFSDKYGPWALIAGGSEGIGAAYAELAAHNGLNVIIIALDQESLDKKASELKERFGVKVVTIRIDLADPGLLDVVLEKTAGLEVGFLVYNAALADVGSHFQRDLDFELKRMAVNCKGPFVLSYHFGREMALRRKGAIILMSSGTGLLGSPYYTHYGATKAYNIVLAEGLWYELKPYNVDVIACIASLTSSPALQNAMEDDDKVSKGEFVQTPQEVAEEAVENLGKKPSIITGAPNRRKMFIVTRLLPRKIGVSQIGKHALDNFLNGTVPDLVPSEQSYQGHTQKEDQ